MRCPDSARPSGIGGWRGISRMLLMPTGPAPTPRAGSRIRSAAVTATRALVSRTGKTLCTTIVKRGTPWPVKTTGMTRQARGPTAS
eukprot:15455683-Alexandrium_andersonii.AAC.1